MNEETILYYGGDHPLSTNECYCITEKPISNYKKESFNIEIIQVDIKLKDLIKEYV